MNTNRVSSILAAAATVALVAVASAAALGAEGVTEKDLQTLYSQGNHKTHSVDDAEMAIRLIRSRFPESESLPALEFRAGENLLTAYMKTGFVSETGGPNVSVAMEHLKRFLPGNADAGAKQAPEARLLYAQGLVVQKQPDAAKAVLTDLAASDPPRIGQEVYKAMAFLREPLAIDEEVLARLEGDILERRRSKGLGETLAEESFVSKFRQSGDSSLGGLQVFRKTQVLIAGAFYLKSVGLGEEAQARMREALAAGQAFLSLPAEGPPPRTLEQDVQARLWVGMARYFLGDYSPALEILETVLPYEDTMAYREGRVPFEGRLYWNACRDALGKTGLSEIDADLLDMLGTGKCAVAQMAWILKELAEHAQRRGEVPLQYLYLRDAADRIRDTAYTWSMAKTMRQLEEKYPGLRETPGTQRSPAHAVMEAAGLITTGNLERLHAEGKKHLYEQRKAEAADPSTKPSIRKWFKPWIPPKERFEDSAVP